MKFLHPPFWPMVLVLAVLSGGILRLLWVTDMEYKGDEEFMFLRSQYVGRVESWPSLGMPSSMGLLNPGMSIWVFVGLGHLGISEPTGLARAVQILNVAALGLLAWFAWRWVAPPQREPWLWAVVLAAWNPLGVFHERKIWAQSTLPLFCVLTLMAWWRRDRWLGAFLWGLVGACLGQIHMSGFFLAAAVLLWTALFARRNVRWSAWLLGSVLGALPLIPWLIYLFQERGELLHLKYAPELWHYLCFWVTESLGLNLVYPLGEHFHEFLSYPLIAGHATYLVAAAHNLIFALGVFLLGNGALLFWRERNRWVDILTGRNSPTRLVVMAGFLANGILLGLSGLPIYHFYLIVLYPLAYVGLALLSLVAPHGRSVLISLCVLELFLSCCFLGYIHVNQGAPRGEYGAVYSAQERLQADEIEIRIDPSLADPTTGQFPPAIERNLQAMRLTPNSALAHMNLGNALLEAGQLQEAIKQYQLALRLKPNYPEALSSLGNALLTLGQLQGAIEDYKLALQLRPDYSEARTNLAIALASAGRREEAIEQYQQAVQFDPDLLQAQNNLGNVLARAGRLEEALPHLEAAVRLKPDAAIIHNNLGVTLADLGRFQEAIDQYQQAIQLDSTYAAAHFNLAKASTKSNREAEAIAAAERGLALARSQGRAALTGQIETWLTKYRLEADHPQDTSPQHGVSDPSP